SRDSGLDFLKKTSGAFLYRKILGPRTGLKIPRKVSSRGDPAGAPLLSFLVNMEKIESAINQKSTDFWSVLLNKAFDQVSSAINQDGFQFRHSYRARPIYCPTRYVSLASYLAPLAPWLKY